MDKTDDQDKEPRQGGQSLVDDERAVIVRFMLCERID